MDSFENLLLITCLKSHMKSLTQSLIKPVSRDSHSLPSAFSHCSIQEVTLFKIEKLKKWCNDLQYLQYCHSKHVGHAELCFLPGFLNHLRWWPKPKKAYMYVHNTIQSEMSRFSRLIPAHVFGELKCSTWLHKYIIFMSSKWLKPSFIS